MRGRELIEKLTCTRRNTTKGNKCRSCTNVVYRLMVSLWKWKYMHFLLESIIKYIQSEKRMEKKTVKLPEKSERENSIGMCAHMSLIYLCIKIYCRNSWVFQKESIITTHIRVYGRDVCRSRTDLWPQQCNLNTSPKYWMHVSVSVFLLAYFSLTSRMNATNRCERGYDTHNYMAIYNGGSVRNILDELNVCTLKHSPTYRTYSHEY